MTQHPDLVANTLRVVRTVSEVLTAHSVRCALIGALAGAHHNYLRSTHDVDLAINVPLHTLRALASDLRAAGFDDVECNEPDADDALGGLIRISSVAGEFQRIDLVNFANPYRINPRVGLEAIETSVPAESLPVPVVDLPHLIALKLYGGGRKQTHDVAILLEHNPDADIASIRAVCARFGLLDALLPLLP